MPKSPKTFAVRTYLGTQLIRHPPENTLLGEKSSTCFILLSHRLQCGGALLTEEYDKTVESALSAPLDQTIQDNRGNTHIPSLSVSSFSI